MWRKFLSRLRTQHRLGNEGVAATELAFVAPMLILLMTGGWDLGNVVYQAERLANAARAGAQFGLATNNNTNYTGMVQAARNDANDPSNALNVTATQVCVCPGGGTPTAAACGANCTGNASQLVYVQVAVGENYTTMFTYPFVSNPVSLSSTVMMRFQ
jgi:Flp pilus assembly protein TadG